MNDEAAYMKIIKPWCKFIYACLLGSGCLFSIASFAAECGTESYSSSDDYSATYPLTKPTVEFSKMLAAAKRGDALAQHNLAVSYDAGYLVNKCPEKAAYWYRRAASGGDEVAKKWVSEQNQLNELATGPECLGSNCYVASSGPQTMTLNADSHGHFRTGITINGVEVVGLIDTGASLVSISAPTANAMGITVAGSHAARSQTANGIIMTFNQLVPTVRIGSIALDNVEIAITPNSPTLIGMSILNRLHMSEANGQMILSK